MVHMSAGPMSNVRARLLLLAGCGLLARVLASEPVYAYAPPGPPSTSSPPKPQKPSPQKPTGARASKPNPSSETASEPPRRDDASGTSAQGESAPSRGADDPSASKPTAKAAKSGKGSDAKPGKSPRKGKGGKRNVIDEEFLIEGKLEKPNAYYILRRSQVDFDWARLDARFSPLVLESVQDPLF
jgi:hypothetical protein